MNAAASIADLLGRLIINIAIPLLNGDKTILNKRVGEILPERLKTQDAFEDAEAKARAKFGPED